MPQTVNVIVITKSEKDKKIIKKKLHDLGNNIPYQITFSKSFEYTEDYCSYDICIFHDESEKLQETKAAIEYIRSNECESKLFIISNMRNAHVLNTLIDINVDGYVNSKDYEFQAIYKTISSICSFRATVDDVERKIHLLERLSALSKIT